MLRLRTVGFTLAVLLFQSFAAHAGQVPDLSRETLSANDGWASLATQALPQGTTGGALRDGVSEHSAVEPASSVPVSVVQGAGPFK